MSAAATSSSGPGGSGAENAHPGGDTGLLSPVSTTALQSAPVSDTAILAAVLRVEETWATVLEEADLAPAGSAALIATAAHPDHYDAADIATRAQAGGTPVIPLVADLRRRVEAVDAPHYGAGRAVHATLTSQDVLDTALMLMARNAVDTLLRDLRSTTVALAALAGDHADTLCVSRSLSQHSLPYTFGLRTAQWFHGLAAAGQQMENVVLPLQFGGAAGTLASATVLTAGTPFTPFDLAGAMAHRLGLAAAPAPWHTNRSAVTSLGNALATVLDALGKIAADVLLLGRPEIGELAEPRVAGRGTSSAMPQKQNPVLSILIRSAALQAPQLAAQLHVAAGNFTDERPDGAWHSEWPALRQLLSLTLGATHHARELLDGLQVFPDTMRRNLDLTGPLLLAESVAAAVAPLIGTRDGRTGKEQLQTIVDRALQAPPRDQGATYRRLLRAAIPITTVDDTRLDELLDPSTYLGQAHEISRRILGAFPAFTPAQAGTDASFPAPYTDRTPR